MDVENAEDEQLKIPRRSTTWDANRSERGATNTLKATHVEPLAHPLVDVREDVQRNLAVTSVDAPVNRGRKSAVWPLTFGLASRAFHIKPVDVYVPGCPPRPDGLLYDIMQLHEKNQAILRYGQDVESRRGTTAKE